MWLGWLMIFTMIFTVLIAFLVTKRT